MERSMILYLRGPITGVDNYQEIFRTARGRLAAMGYKVINPAEMIGVLHEGASYEDFLDIDLALLAKADVLVQLPDWESSRGANRELGFALGTDKIVVSLDSLLGGGDGRGPAGDLWLSYADPENGIRHQAEAAPV